MSSRERGFSHRDREELQELIEADHPKATRWIKRREKNRILLEGQIDLTLIQEAQEVMLSVPRTSDYQNQPEAAQALQDISGMLRVWELMQTRPANPKVAAAGINETLEKNLNFLSEIGLWTRPKIEQ